MSEQPTRVPPAGVDPGGTGVLVITGAPTTGTSSMTRLANSHRDVFVLFEAELICDVPGRWAREFLSHFPEARRLYWSRQDILLAYRDLADVLAERGFRYRWVGIKQPDLDARFLSRVRAASIVYCTRDIRTWLAKRQIQSNYLTAMNIVPAAATLTAALIESFDLPRVMHVTLEDLVAENAGVQERFAEFLGLQWSGPVSYWEAVPAGGAGDPKHAIAWADAHQSSGLRPERLDARATVRDGPFWDALLPLFGRYHAAAAGGTVPDADQRHRDLDVVRALPRRFQVPFAQAFQSTVDEATKPTPSRLRVAASLARQAARVLAHGAGR